MIWLVFGVLILVALVIVVPPLLRRTTADGETSDLAVYRDQLREIDNDLERGLISPAEAEAARLEIKRRMLAASQRASTVSLVAPRAAVALAVALGLSAFSGALYLTLGRPTLPDRAFDPAAVRAVEEEEAAKAMLAQVEGMIARLADKLKANPNDAMGWRMLGWSYLQLGRTKDGVDALERAVTLAPKDAALRAQYGEGVVRLADGKVTSEAAKIFDEALALNAKEPRARFYRGLALVQAGKEREALDLWVAIIRDGPADAAWMAGLREQATVLAEKLKLDPKAVVP